MCAVFLFFFYKYIESYCNKNSFLLLQCFRRYQLEKYRRSVAETIFSKENLKDLEIYHFEAIAAFTENYESR